MPTELPASEMPPKVLVVDDDERVLALHARILARDGFEVETARNGETAIAALHERTFDVVLSDVEMPGMSGIHLIDEVRRHDIDVPIIVITGAPTMETAIQALDRGALRYLTKPAGADDLLKAVRDAVRLHRIATAKRQALALAGRNGIFAGDLAGLTVSFERALTSVALVFQPIVSCSTRRVVAYEALMRSHEPGLPGPHAILDAAERLDRVHDLGRRLRYLCTQAILAIPEPARLFINIHPPRAAR
jgi:DNA-binding response OmpR family regulator